MKIAPPPPPIPSQQPQQQIVTIRSSSRYLLDNNNNLKNKFLSKFNHHQSSSSSHRHQKSLSEPSSPPLVATMPSTANLEEEEQHVIEIDPWLMCVKSAMELAIHSDWLQKYEQPTTPTFRFGKSWKKRLFILVDRIVFCFKSSKATNPAREHFLLTEDTFVFVTEEFKKGYIIELRKPLTKWFIRCDSVQQLKTWLEAMKKIVACIKIGYDGLLTKMILTSITLTDDYRILIPTKGNAAAATSTSTIPSTTLVDNNKKKLYRTSLPASSSTISSSSPLSSNVSITRKHSLNSSNTTETPPTRPPSRQQQTKRQSLAEIPDWETTLPPQMPPPRSKPPPVPSLPLLPTVSE